MTAPTTEPTTGLTRRRPAASGRRPAHSRTARSAASGLHARRGFAELFEAAAERACDAEQQVGEWRPIGGNDEAIALDATTAADHGDRERIVVVCLAIAHARAEHDERVVEQRALPVGGVLEALDERGEE